MIDKINFIIESNGNGNSVKDLKLEVYINGSDTPSKYTNEGFNVYKYKENMKLNNLAKEQKLSNDYILNENEEYVIEIKELKVDNKTYNGGIYQSGGFTFINGVDISEIREFSMGSSYDTGKSESFRFLYNYKEVEVQQEEVLTTGTSDTQPTEVISQPVEYVVPIEEHNSDTNYFLYGIICGLLIVIVVMSICIAKIKKDK